MLATGRFLGSDRLFCFIGIRNFGSFKNPLHYCMTVVHAVMTALQAAAENHGNESGLI